MTHDPDLLAIQRKRRQDGRCLKCTTRAPRAALCAACRAEWRYCPRCERVHRLDESYAPSSAGGRSTAYCRPCGNIVRNGPQCSRAERLAADRARVLARVAKVLPLYRRGVPMREIAAKLQMSSGALSGLISHARTHGLWPDDLRRRRPNKQTREL